MKHLTIITLNCTILEIIHDVPPTFQQSHLDRCGFQQDEIRAALMTMAADGWIRANSHGPEGYELTGYGTACYGDVIALEPFTAEWRRRLCMLQVLAYRLGQLRWWVFVAMIAGVSLVVCGLAGGVFGLWLSGAWLLVAAACIDTAIPVYRWYLNV